MSAPEPNDPMRDCSLPPGCKDLIDAIRLQPARIPLTLPPITRRVTLPEEVAVEYVTELLGIDMDSFRAETRKLGICGWGRRCLSFDDARKLLRRHGIWALGPSVTMRMLLPERVIIRYWDGREAQVDDAVVIDESSRAVVRHVLDTLEKSKRWGLDEYGLKFDRVFCSESFLREHPVDLISRAGA
jgi:hypothetical protein